MAEDCLPQVHACMIRVARLWPDGTPKLGGNNLYVTDVLASLGFAWEVEDGDEISDKNACGAVTVNYKAPATLKRGNLTIALLTRNPGLEEMLSGGSVLTDGAKVGASAEALGPINEDPVSIEVWVKRIRDGVLDGTYPYAQWGYPFVNKLRHADHEHSQSTLQAQFVGEAYENDNWADGPANDWSVATDRVWQWMPTATIPTSACGYQAIAAS